MSECSQKLVIRIAQGDYPFVRYRHSNGNDPSCIRMYVLTSVLYNNNAQQQLQNNGLRPDLNWAQQVIGRLTYLKQF